MTGVNQSLRLERQTTGKLALEQPLRARGFSEGTPAGASAVTSRIATEQQGQVVLRALGPGPAVPSTQKHALRQPLPEQARLVPLKTCRGE